MCWNGLNIVLSWLFGMLGLWLSIVIIVLLFGVVCMLILVVFVNFSVLLIRLLMMWCSVFGCVMSVSGVWLCSVMFCFVFV